MSYKTHCDTSLFSVAAVKQDIDIHGSAWKANKDRPFMHKFLSHMNCIEKTVIRCILKIQGFWYASMTPSY